MNYYYKKIDYDFGYERLQPLILNGVAKLRNVVNRKNG